MAFKQAFALYNDPNRDIKTLKPMIFDIISDRNSKRINYTMPSDHSIISKNWLIREGRTYILLLNRYKVDNSAISVLLLDKGGERPGSFLSVVECAKYLGIARSTVKRRAENGQQELANLPPPLKSIKENNISSSFSGKGKLVTIKIIENI